MDASGRGVRPGLVPNLTSIYSGITQFPNWRAGEDDKSFIDNQ
jgi:hypothetical protein